MDIEVNVYEDDRLPQIPSSSQYIFITFWSLLLIVALKRNRHTQGLKEKQTVRQKQESQGRERTGLTDG